MEAADTLADHAIRYSYKAANRHHLGTRYRTLRAALAEQDAEKLVCDECDGAFTPSEMTSDLVGPSGGGWVLCLRCALKKALAGEVQQQDAEKASGADYEKAKSLMDAETLDKVELLERYGELTPFTLMSRLRRCEEALRPFAALHAKNQDVLADACPIYETEGGTITAGDVRNATTALANRDSDKAVLPLRQGDGEESR